MKIFTVDSNHYRDHLQQFDGWQAALGYSHATRRSQSDHLKEFFHWLEEQDILRVEQVGPRHLQTFYDWLQVRPNYAPGMGGGLSATTIYGKVHTLEVFFSSLESKGIMANPMHSVRRHYPEKITRDNLLTVEEVQRLQAACVTARERVVLALLYGCGLRRREAVRLDIDDVNFRSGLVHVKKSKWSQRRNVPMSGKVKEELQQYYYHGRRQHVRCHHVPTRAFVLSIYGYRLLGQGYGYEIKRLVQRAGVDPRVSPHYLRHAIGTHLLEAGLSLEQVKEFLGHKSIVSTQTYTHISKAYLKSQMNYEAGNLSAPALQP